MVLDKDFREFIQLLNENEVKYLVIGGYAVAFHGYPRYTKDLDFWIWANPDNADRVDSMMDDISVHFMGLDDLIKNKLSTGRMQDKVDADKLKGRKK